MSDDGFLKDKGITNVIAGLRGEYMYFFCEQCGSRVRMKFLGHDMATPKFESICKCGQTYQFKAIISDVPVLKKV
jgi:NAD-dependent SIR2 family protein deacetylase